MSDSMETSQSERYFDGVLSPAEAAAFEKELADSDTLKAEMAMLSLTREFLQSSSEAELENVNFDGLFERIQQELPAQKQMEKAVPTPAPTQSEPGMGERVRQWWRTYWTPVLVSAAAAAAVAFLITRAATPAALDDDEAPTFKGYVAVDEVNNEGPKTVLISQSAEEEGATVIWLLDEEDSDDTAPTGEDPI